MAERNATEGERVPPRNDRTRTSEYSAIQLGRAERVADVGSAGVPEP